jgi:hypothetical protein
MKMTIMKTTKILIVFVLAALFTSCDDNEVVLLDVESETVTNLHAPQSGGQGQPISGDFTKFDFDTGTTTTSETDWDIAFRGTTIIVNGGTSQGTTDEPVRTSTAGAYIANGTLASVTEVNTNLFSMDTASSLAIPTGSDNGWYNYSGPPFFLITPLAGKIIVVRTSDNRYAKMEILSYYKDAPANPDAMTDESRYYTFNYVYQPNAGIATFE